MRNALDRNDVDFQDKAHLYQQVLWRYLERFDQYRDKPLRTVIIKRSADSPPATKVTTSPLPWGRLEEEVLESVRRTMKKKVERLLQRLQQHPQFKWNNQGEIEFEGQLVKNSNLVDLVNNVLRKRKKTLSQKAGKRLPPPSDALTSRKL